MRDRVAWSYSEVNSALLQFVGHAWWEDGALGSGGALGKPKSSAGIDQPANFILPSSCDKAERMVWSNCSSLKGLSKNATAPACIARP
jgi:hypothetical protein